MKSLKVVVIDIINDTKPIDNLVNNRSGSEAETEYSRSRINLGSSVSYASFITDDRSRLSASMFSADFNPMMRSLVSNSSLSKSQFQGSDPSIGVSVMRSSKYLKAIEEIKEDHFAEEKDKEKQDSEEEDDAPSNIELYVKASEADGKLGKQIKIYEGEVEDRTMVLDPNANQLEMNICLYADNRYNAILLRFDYSFTQKGDKEIVHSKSLQVQRQIKSESPFKIDWQVLTKDPFLSSLKTNLLQLTKQSEDSDFQAITGKMIASNEETVIVKCRLTSIASTNKMQLCRAWLEVNPSLSEFIEQIEQINTLDESIELEPGEQFDCLFKLRIKKLDAVALEEINHMFGEVNFDPV